MRHDFQINPPGQHSPRRTTEADIAIIKGQLDRGDEQHHIAAYWGANSGRICETNTGKRYAWVKPATADLPPPGPPAAAATAATIQITGVAEKFWQCQQRMEQKIDQLQVQLAGFGRRVGLIENPKFPRIAKSRPLEG
jgi:hypothetical protein